MDVSSIDARILSILPPIPQDLYSDGGQDSYNEKYVRRILRKFDLTLPSSNKTYLSLIDAIATCIGTGALGSTGAVIFEGGLTIFFVPIFLLAVFPEAELVMDGFDGPLIETLFDGLSSGAGEAGLFFVTNFPRAVLFADVGSEGRFEALPPLIFSANNFLCVQTIVALLVL